MKALFALSCALALLPLTLPAQEPAAKEKAPAIPTDPTTRKEVGPASLHDEMGAINRNVRKLTRQYADPAQKASSLEIVAALQKSAEVSKTNFPEKAEKMPEDEKAKYIALFTKDMEALSQQLTDLKAAIEAGDNDKVKAQLDALNQLKTSSHKELGVKEDRRGGPGGRGGPGAPARPGNDSMSAGGVKIEPSPAAGSQPTPAGSPAVSPQP